MINVKEINLNGCYELTSTVFNDQRGNFIKIFHKEIFKNFGLATDFKEEYYSISKPRVLRGMHFQLPPKDHTKLITCIAGCVIDVVVDIRKNSNTYGQYCIFELNENKFKSIYIPSGFAHGFYVIGSKNAIMLYKVTSVFSKEHDYGIHWNSIGIPWPDNNPIVSCKDENLPHLDYFNNIF